MTPHEPTDAQIALALRDWLEQGVNALPDGMQLPAPVRDQIISQVPTTPQRRRWWTDRWSTRGRGVMRSDDVPGDRDGRRSRRMFGFATLLAAGTIGGAALLAGINQQQAEPGPRTIVVAQDGSGDVVTMAKGVALAVDGDTVLVRPGVYAESLIITADITLTGDGPREAVIIETPSDGPRSGDFRVYGGYALQLDETTATIRGLTLLGVQSRVVINGGAPTLEDLHLKDVDLAYTGGSSPESAIHINAGSKAVIRDSLLEGGGEIGIFEDSSPLIEDNVLRDGPHIWVYAGTGGSTPVIRGNVIEGFNVRGIATWIPTSIVIEGNTVRASGDGIVLAYSDPGEDATVRGNTVEVTGIGIQIEGIAPTIADNDISGAKTGISLVNGRKAVLTDNRIHGNEVGIYISTGDPTFQGNTLCENERNVRLGPAQPAPDLTGNEVCPDLRSPEPTAAP